MNSKTLAQGETVLGSLKNPKSKSASIVISALNIPREIGPGDWLEIAIVQNMEKILNRRDVPSKGGIVADLLTVSQSSDKTTMISRQVAIKDGNRIFHIRATASEVEYPSVADDFLLAVSSVKPVNAENSFYAENLMEYKSKNKKFGFKFPSSWNLKEIESPISSNQDSFVQMVQLEDQIDKPTRAAFIIVIFASVKNNSQQLVETYIEWMKLNGIDVGFVTSSTVPEPSPYTSGENYTIQAARNKKELFSTAITLRHPQSLILIGLTGPSRIHIPLAWGVSKRALEIIRDNLLLE